VSVHLAVDQHEIGGNAAECRGEAVRPEGCASAIEPCRAIPPPRHQGGTAVVPDEAVEFISLERRELEAVRGGQWRRIFITGKRHPVARCRQPAGQLDGRVNEAGQSSRYDEQVRVYVTSIWEGAVGR
jgi:hypothetical protein